MAPFAGQIVRIGLWKVHAEQGRVVQSGRKRGGSTWNETELRTLDDLVATNRADDRPPAFTFGGVPPAGGSGSCCAAASSCNGTGTRCAGADQYVSGVDQCVIRTQEESS